MTTKNLLVELFVEELPPKALKKLGDAFANQLFEQLKAQGLAGLRIGYGIGHPAVIGDIDKVALPFAVNALAQAAALAALDHPEEIAERVARVVEERIRVESALRESGWDLADHRGNFIWLPTGADTGRVALDLERAGVVVRSFGDEGIRVTIGTRAENDRFLTALAGVSPTG